MPTTPIIALAAVAVLAWAGSAEAQQATATSTGSSSSAEPSASTSVRTGACIVTGARGTTSCSAQIDEGGCRAQGLETQSKTAWTRGQGCP